MWNLKEEVMGEKAPAKQIPKERICMVFRDCTEASGGGYHERRDEAWGTELRAICGLKATSGWLAVLWRKQGSQHRTEMCVFHVAWESLRWLFWGHWKGLGRQRQGRQLNVQCWVFPSVSVQRWGHLEPAGGGGNRWWGQTWTSFEGKANRICGWTKSGEWEQGRSQGWLQAFAWAVKEPSCY